MGTHVLKEADLQHDWYTVDATGKVLGALRQILPISYVASTSPISPRISIMAIM